MKRGQTPSPNEKLSIGIPEFQAEESNSFADI
jgi:hypothetical protein